MDPHGYYVGGVMNVNFVTKQPQSLCSLANGPNFEFWSFVSVEIGHEKPC